MLLTIQSAFQIPDKLIGEMHMRNKNSVNEIKTIKQV